jgi:hypothetical protein
MYALAGAESRKMFLYLPFSRTGPPVLCGDPLRSLAASPADTGAIALP